MKRAESVFNGICNVPDIEIAYRGYRIVPKKDFSVPYLSVNEYRKGYCVIEKDRNVNVAPGASWAITVSSAKDMIDAIIEAGEDKEKYHDIIEKREGRDLYEEV